MRRSRAIPVSGSSYPSLVLEPCLSSLTRVHDASDEDVSCPQWIDNGEAGVWQHASSYGLFCVKSRIACGDMNERSSHIVFCKMYRQDEGYSAEQRARSSQSLGGEGPCGVCGPRTGNSSGVCPGNSCGTCGASGSCIGGGTSGLGFPGGISRGGSVGVPGVAGGTSGGSPCGICGSGANSISSRIGLKATATAAACSASTQAMS